jgi:hypothetical protein
MSLTSKIRNKHWNIEKKKMKLTSVPNKFTSQHERHASTAVIVAVTNQETRDGSGACDSGRGEAGVAGTLKGNAPVSHCKVVRV